MANSVETVKLRLDDQASNKAKIIKDTLHSIYQEAVKLQNLNKRIQFKIDPKNIITAKSALIDFNNQIKNLTRANIQLKFDFSSLNTAEKRIERIIQNVKRLNSIQSTFPSENIRKVKGSESVHAGSDTQQTNYNDTKTGVLEALGTRFFAQLGTTIERSFYAGVVQGTKNIAFGNSKLKQLGYTHSQIKEIDANSYSMSSAFKGIVSPADIRSMYANLGTSAGTDLSKITPIIENEVLYKVSLLNKGYSDEQANLAVQELSNTLVNILNRNNSGNNISGNINDYLSVIVQETIRTHSNVTPQMINTAVIYGHSASKALPPDGLRNLLNIQYSLKQFTGNSLDRFATTLTDATTAKALKAQAEWGLVTNKGIIDDTPGNNIKTKAVRGTPIDEELLRSDPNQWFVRYFMPQIVKRANIDPYDQKAIDTLFNDPARIAKIIEPLFGKASANNIALDFASWQRELTQAREASSNVADIDKQKQIAFENPVLALQSVKTETVNLLGEIGNSLSKDLVVPLHHLSNAISNISQWIRDGDKDGSSSASRGVVVTAGAAAASYGGYKLFEMITGFNNLKVASVNLNEAARNLNQAVGRGFGNSYSDTALPERKRNNRAWRMTSKSVPLLLFSSINPVNLNNDQQNTNTSNDTGFIKDMFSDIISGASMGAVGGPRGVIAGATLGLMYNLYKHLPSRDPEEKAHSLLIEGVKTRLYDNQIGSSKKLSDEELEIKAIEQVQLFKDAGGIILTLKQLEKKGMNLNDPDIINPNKLLFGTSPIERDQEWERFQQKINSKSTDISREISDEIEIAGNQSGTAMATALISAAPSIGQAIANAINSNINTPSVDMNVPIPIQRPNTGTNSNDVK